MKKKKIGLLPLSQQSFGESEAPLATENALLIAGYKAFSITNDSIQQKHLFFNRKKRNL